MLEQTLPLADGSHFVRVQGAGDPIVFLHGFPLDGGMWLHQQRAFAASHTTVVPDLRGHGRSSPADTATMDQMAQDVLAILDRLSLPGPLTVCGLSMGGYVAWALWRLAAERVARLVLCDTRAVADAPEVARGREMMASSVMQSGMSEVAATMVPKLLAKSSQQNEPLVQQVTRTILAAPPAGVAAAQRGMAVRPDMRDQLAKVNVPTLLLAGDEDSISPPEEMRAIAAAMPHATFVEIPGAGHLAPLEQPEHCNQAIREFLANS